LARTVKELKADFKKMLKDNESLKERVRENQAKLETFHKCRKYGMVDWFLVLDGHRELLVPRPQR
jgi:hypothetical protein